jgi:hypothetical protein
MELLQFMGISSVGPRSECTAAPRRGLRLSLTISEGVGRSSMSKGSGVGRRVPVHPAEIPVVRPCKRHTDGLRPTGSTCTASNLATSSGKSELLRQPCPRPGNLDGESDLRGKIFAPR